MNGKSLSMWFAFLLTAVLLVVCTLTVQAKQPELRIPSEGIIQTSVNLYLPLVLKNASAPSWKVSISPTTVDLYDVYALSAADVWAVGKGGTILHWDGVSWQMVVSPTSDDLRSIAMRTPTEGWALSSSNWLNWNGTIWEINTDLPSVAQPTRMDVDTDGEDFWFVGGYALCNPTCYDFHGLIYRWNTILKTGQIFYVSHTYFSNIDMLSPEDGWASGEVWSGTSYSAIARWNGISWTSSIHPPARWINSIAAFDSTHAWAVGVSTDFTCTSMFWNGTIWSEVACPDNAYFGGVDFDSADRAWAVGYGGSIGFSNGASWTLVDSPVTTDLSAIDMLSSNEGWAVGKGGVILHYTSGAP